MIPTDTAPDSLFMYRRMQEATFAALHLSSGARVLDLAGGTGADAATLAALGFRVIASEPSAQMIGLGQLAAAQDSVRAQVDTLTWVRSFGEKLPFADDSFDATYCKGSLDHFEDPRAAMRELARVTRKDGRVVLAVANMSGLGRRLAARQDTRDRLLHGGRRASDIPADHLTRYDSRLLCSHFAQFVDFEGAQGVSLLWSCRTWRALLRKLPDRLCNALLLGGDWVARRAPKLADVTILAGRPRP